MFSVFYIDPEVKAKQVHWFIIHLFKPLEHLGPLKNKNWNSHYIQDETHGYGFHKLIQGKQSCFLSHNEFCTASKGSSAATLIVSCLPSSWSPTSSDLVRWRPSSPAMTDNLASAPITWRLLCSHQQWWRGVLPIHLLLNPHRTEPNSR